MKGTVEVIPPYSPLPEGVSVQQSNIHGLGLFASEFIDKYKNLGISHVGHPLFRDGWIRTPLGGFYNHSEKPNCKIVDAQLQDGTPVKVLVSSKDIIAGEELTCWYTIWNINSVQEGEVHD